MGVIGGGKHGAAPISQQPNLLHSLRVQTSSVNTPLTLVYGQNRVAGKLGWAGPLVPVPHSSAVATGGKGGGSKKISTNVQYTYNVAIAIFLCVGPTQGLYNVWDTKGKLALLTATENFTVPGGGGTYTTTHAGNYYDDFGVGRQDAYSFSQTDFGSPGSVLYSGNFNTKMLRTSSAPATGQYKYLGSGQYQFAAGDTGKQMSITYTYSVPDSTGTGQPATTLSLNFFPGSVPQSPWGYLTTNFAGQDLNYPSCSYVASPAMDLGTSGSLPNYTYEVIGKTPFGSGFTDANPMDIITDLLPSTLYGPSFPASFLGSPTQYSNYCIANGLFISPILEAQRAARDHMQDWLDATNSTVVWSEGVLKFIPYGDTTVVGNGAIYIPNTTPVVDLGDDDYSTQAQAGNHVKTSRVAAANQKNAVSVQWTNRSNSYNADLTDETSLWHQQLYGAMPETSARAYDFITTQAVATFAANTILNRNVFIIKKYAFQLPWRYSFIEPMDLVTLTETQTGMAKEPVRIISVTENVDGTLDIIAEEFPWGTATATLYSKQAINSSSPQQDADPGNVNTPIIFEAPAALSKSGQHEVWFGVSGALSSYGGCSVWLSQDGTEYKKVGEIYGPARQGVLTANVAAGTDPDATNFFPVNFGSSFGSVLNGTKADADTFRTLCYCNGEFLAYRDANLTSTFNYQIGRSGAGVVYTRRGLYGTTPAAHLSGASFLRLDDAVFTYAYDPALIGKTISIKLTSFNATRTREQLTSAVSPFTFTLLGLYNPNNVIGVNLLGNPGFELNVSATPIGTARSVGQSLFDNWTYQGHNSGYLDGSPYFTVEVENGGVAFAHSGANNLLIRLSQSVSIPVAANFYQAVAASDKVAVTPGQRYSIGAYVRCDKNATFPAGVTSVGAMRPLFYDNQGNLISEGIVAGEIDLTNSSVTGVYTVLGNFLTIPATVSGIVPAFMAIECSSWVINSSAGAFATSTNLYWDVRFDDIWCIIQNSLGDDSSGKQGSTSNTYTGGLTYTSTTNSITWSWNLVASRTDLHLINQAYSGSQAVTGLAAATAYNFYPFIDEFNGIVSMVATGGTGTPSWAHSGTAVAWAQEQTRSDHYPLTKSPLAGSTTASGGGSGGGGGIGGVCLRWDMLVRTRDRGVIHVRNLHAGDWISCPVADDTPDGWVLVLETKEHNHTWEWVLSQFNVGDYLVTTPGHPFTLADGTMRRAAQLSLEDSVPCETGITFPTSISMEKAESTKVAITVASAAHTFYSGARKPQILNHNFIPDS